jgi:hypothetical protein
MGGAQSVAPFPQLVASALHAGAGSVYNVALL